MGKGIGRIYKYDQWNCPYQTPNNNFFIPQHYDNSIQSQYKITLDVSVGAHDVASYGWDQSTNYHDNTDVKDNDDSKSFETPRKNNGSYSSFGDTINTSTTPCISTLSPPGK